MLGEEKYTYIIYIYMWRKLTRSIIKRIYNCYSGVYVKRLIVHEEKPIDKEIKNVMRK